MNRGHRSTTSHTPQGAGTKHIREASEKDAATMGNKNVEKAIEIADLPRVMCDGNEYTSSVPTCGYNFIQHQNYIGL